MPRMREAKRSGMNGSRASTFSPTPMNLIGRPVTARMESAAPPRASPSIFVMMKPVMPSNSSISLATLTASCPVMASTTSNVSVGWKALRSRFSSAATSASMVV